MTAGAATRGLLNRVAQRVERGLRLVGGPRFGGALLLVAALANAAAAGLPAWRWLLDSPLYLALIAAIALSGIATVGVRSAPAWREWRRPTPLAGGGRLASAVVALRDARLVEVAALAVALRRAGYRVRRSEVRGRWQLAGVRHGWAHFAGIASHLSLVVIVVGAAIGTAFAEETRFGLFPGEQSLLAAPRAGQTSAIRFDRLDAEFNAGGRPLRFDTHVTLFERGAAVGSRILRVNEPADFAGHLVHAWTYGPAVAVRVVDLGGGVLFDGWVALGGERTGSRAPFVELPQLGITLGFEIADATRNRLAAIAADERGRLLDTTVLGPGQSGRLARVTVAVERFASYVTFMSRSDPGVLVVFAGAGLLCLSLAAGLMWPRKRIDLIEVPGGLRVRVRVERFDDPAPELARLLRSLQAPVK